MFKNVQAVMDGANTDASHVLKTTVSVPLHYVASHVWITDWLDPFLGRIIGLLEGYG